MCATMDERMKMITCNGEVSSAVRLLQRLGIRSQLWTAVMLLSGDKWLQLYTWIVDSTNNICGWYGLR
ncbi:hypothetical protein HanIR_Chr16g0792231 [Helianthus annuus]|nr:hypothetical protein HanIR_Chr16g0792231 [Helianthus annuus]